jgi:hypothetical protein
MTLRTTSHPAHPACTGPHRPGDLTVIQVTRIAATRGEGRGRA